jgi:hypothetical protein
MLAAVTGLMAVAMGCVGSSSEQAASPIIDTSQVSGKYWGTFTARTQLGQRSYFALLVLGKDGLGELEVPGFIEHYYDGPVIASSMTEDTLTLRFQDVVDDWIVAVLDRAPGELSGNWSYEEARFELRGELALKLAVDTGHLVGDYRGTYTTDAGSLAGTHQAFLVLTSDETGFLDCSEDYYDSAVTIVAASDESVTIQYRDADRDTMTATLEIDGDRLSGPWKYDSPEFNATGDIAVSRPTEEEQP